MEITRTQTQEEGAGNVNSTFKKSVLWNPWGYANLETSSFGFHLSKDWTQGFETFIKWRVLRTQIKTESL